MNHNRTKDDLETLPRVFLALSSCITTVTADPDRVRTTPTQASCTWDCTRARQCEPYP